MADYSTIKGFTVQVLSADPPAPGEGQVWYNTTTGTLKGYGQIGTGAWSTGGACNDAVADREGVGTTPAALALGGQPSSYYKAVESYDGTSWTEITAMTDNHYSVGGAAGTQTAAIVFGGYPTTTATETWNGSSWTEGGAMNTGHENAYCAIRGTVTASLVAGGNPGDTVNVELYNGTAWTETTNLNTGKRGGGGAGTQTSMITFGGYPPTNANATESWDGTTWTEKTDMGTGRYALGNAGDSNTSAMAAGGTYPPGNRLSICEQWDGSSWTEVGDLVTEKENGAGGGSTMSAFYAAGLGPPGTPTGTTYEWWVPTTTKTFSAS